MFGDEKWYHSKTVWTGIMSIFGSVGAAAVGEVSNAIAIQTSVTSLLGIFLRTGMMKAARK